MKILIVGSEGMLGSDLTKVLNKNHEIMATTAFSMDITDSNQVKSRISSYKPDIVINSAAYTNVDGCESNPDLAYEVNSVGVKNLAISCEKYNSKLIHISTDYVFNGEKNKPYLEGDMTSPINVYGRTKLKGEEFIQDILDEYFIIRTSWLYGKNGDNFVKTMLELSKGHDEISVVNDQRGSPTYTHDLAIAISQLVEKYDEKEFYGIYNVTNSKNCSWFEFAKDIFEIANVDITLKPVSTDEFPRPAKRPKYSVLTNEKWISKGFTPLRNYKDALFQYIKLI